MKTGNHTADLTIAAQMQAQDDRIAELEALLTRVMVAGNARLPTKLLLDIRALLGKESEDG